MKKGVLLTSGPVEWRILPSSAHLAWPCPVLSLGIGLRRMNHLEGGTGVDTVAKTHGQRKKNDDGQRAT